MRKLHRFRPSSAFGRPARTQRLFLPRRSGPASDFYFKLPLRRREVELRTVVARRGFRPLKIDESALWFHSNPSNEWIALKVNVLTTVPPRRLPGVVSTRVGYSGGDVANFHAAGLQRCRNG